MSQASALPTQGGVLHITDIESAINYLRMKFPSPDGIALSARLQNLAEVYALMAYHREEWVALARFPPAAYAAWLQWYDTTPDTPCIAICSTAQGDSVCKGCGRSFEEVQNWQVYEPAEKRLVWRRISLEASAWRFNKYAERAQERK